MSEVIGTIVLGFVILLRRWSSRPKPPLEPIKFTVKGEERTSEHITQEVVNAAVRSSGEAGRTLLAQLQAHIQHCHSCCDEYENMVSSLETWIR